MDKLLYSDGDEYRITEATKKLGSLKGSGYRTNFRRDFGRLIHSPSFRRLQGKTQLFPWAETDFFRNRLTHSIEVAQIAKMIAIKLNDSMEFFKRKGFQINTDIVEFAGLAHDLGHPPFGHTGEYVLNMLMKEHGGFEGNAQTLRLLAKIEKKENNHEKPIDSYGNDKRCGLNLTMRTLASILKYNNEIPYKRDKDELIKGYYRSEAKLVKKIIQKVTGYDDYDGDFKTIECHIMDVADDIAYSTYDLEDALKAKFISSLDCIYASDELLDKISKKVSEGLKKQFGMEEVRTVLRDVFGWIFQPTKINYDILTELGKLNPDKKIIDSYIMKMFDIAYKTSLELQINGYSRTSATSELVDNFINGVEVEINSEIPALSRVYLNKDTREKVEVLKHFVYESLILSPRLKIVEQRGYEIVSKIFQTLVNKDGPDLLPDDYKYLYHNINPREKYRIICDFVAGMTDRYAIEFYGRLTSENPETIFKPF